MAMTNAGLKSKIISEMQSKGFNPTNSATNGEAEAYIEALATAIVEYIQSNADVNVTSGSSAGTYQVT